MPDEEVCAVNDKVGEVGNAVQAAAPRAERLHGKFARERQDENSLLFAVQQHMHQLSQAGWEGMHTRLEPSALQVLTCLLEFGKDSDKWQPTAEGAPALGAVLYAKHARPALEAAVHRPMRVLLKGVAGVEEKLPSGQSKARSKKGKGMTKSEIIHSSMEEKLLSVDLPGVLRVAELGRDGFA